MKSGGIDPTIYLVWRCRPSGDSSPTASAGGDGGGDGVAVDAKGDAVRVGKNHRAAGCPRRYGIDGGSYRSSGITYGSNETVFTY